MQLHLIYSPRATFTTFLMLFICITVPWITLPVKYIVKNFFSWSYIKCIRKGINLKSTTRMRVFLCYKSQISTKSSKTHIPIQILLRVWCFHVVRSVVQSAEIVIKISCRFNSKLHFFLIMCADFLQILLQIQFY